MRTGALGSALGESERRTKQIVQQASPAPASTPGTVTIRSGIIVMWAGTIAEIPEGWLLCNGSNGTPDLRDRFVKSVGTAEEPGGTGGAATHVHGVGSLAAANASAGTPAGTIGAHTTAADTAVTGAGTRVIDGAHVFSGDALGAHGHSITGETASVNHEPAYYKLAFIMQE